MKNKAFGSVFAWPSAVLFLLLFGSAGLAVAQTKIEAIAAIDVTFSTIGSGQPGIAQGGWAQMFGEGLADDDDNTSISVNGVMTLSIALSSGRVFFRIPPETALGPAQVTVAVGGQTDTFEYPVSQFAPTGFIEGDTFHGDGSPITEANPLRPGDGFIANGLTGLGVSQPPQLTIVIGGQPAAITSLVDDVSLGGVPALPGLFVVEGTVPNLAPGCYSATLEIGGASWTFDHPDDLIAIGAAGGSEAASCSSEPRGPQFTSESLLGGAAFGPAASGGLASLFVGLSDFVGDAAETAPGIPLPPQLGDVTVEFTPSAASGAGRAQGAPIQAPLVYFSGPANQINLQIPWEVPPGPASVVVTAGGVRSDPVALQIEEFAPGLFTFDFGEGRAVAFFNDGAIVHPEGTLSLAARPAAIGEAFSLLATGLGPTSPAAVTGDNSSIGGDFVRRDTIAVPTVTIGGVAAQVFGSILSPEFVGVYQVVVIPQAGTPTGDAVPIVIEVSGTTSRDDVTVAIGPAP